MSPLERTMSPRLPLLVTLVLVSLVPRPVRPDGVAEPDWSFSDQDAWPGINAQCGGPRQSPVALDTTEERYWQDGGRPKLRFAPLKHLKAGSITVTNTGRTLKISMLTSDEEPPVLIKGRSPGPLSGTYCLDHLHLHWNDENGGRGSEHRMNDMFEAAEAHFVFFNEKYGSVSAALDEPDGLAVVGLLLRSEQPEVEGSYRRRRSLNDFDPEDEQNWKSSKRLGLGMKKAALRGALKHLKSKFGKSKSNIHDAIEDWKSSNGRQHGLPQFDLGGIWERVRPRRRRPDLELPTLGLADIIEDLRPLGSTITRQCDLRPLRPLLRSALVGLFNYEGSLTTPPCSPVVTWMVCDQTVPVAEEFLEQLRSLFADEQGYETITNNFRELQDLAGRDVFHYSFDRASSLEPETEECD